MATTDTLQSRKFVILDSYWSVGLVYFLSWIIVFNSFSGVIRLLVIGILIILQLQSYRLSTLIVLLTIFFPFFHDFIRDMGISGLTPFRLVFIPFIYQSISIKKYRRFPVNNVLLVGVIISILSLKITATILTFMQDIPIQRRFDMVEPSIFNQVASFTDVIIYLSLFYYSFTRLSLKDLQWVFDGFLLLVLFEALTICFLVFENPDAVFGFSDQLKQTGKLNRIMWNNPWFGQKNEWGIMFSFAIAITVIRMVNNPVKRRFYILILLGLLCGVGFSLSRQAYLYMVIIWLMVLMISRDYRLIIGSLSLVIILLAIKPDFIVSRLESTLEIVSISDAQSINRKFSEQASTQIMMNFQFIPRMFYTTRWEYNWSEGFWNGMLHQQGIAGLVFHLILYGFILLRYLYLCSISNKKLKTYIYLGIVITILMFISNFNQRTIHFISYSGLFSYNSVLNLFIFCYIELAIYSYKSKLQSFKVL